MGATTGSFIREKRKAKNLTQEQLAERVGVSKNTVGDWEADKYLPKFDKAELLAKAIDVGPLDIYAGEVLPDIGEEIREALEEKVRTLNEQVDNVQNVTINIEDTGIASLDIAVTALMFSFFAIAMGIWAVFPHTTMNRICCGWFAVIGVIVMVFGRKAVKVLERRQKERAQ